MQKLPNEEMSKNNKNINNFFEAENNNNAEYRFCSILAELKYLNKRHEETDMKLNHLGEDIKGLSTVNGSRSEIFNKKIDDIEKSITEKINKSDENTNNRFSLMQSEITALKGSDNQKAMDILKKGGALIFAVITAIAIAIATKAIQIN